MIRSKKLKNRGRSNVRWVSDVSEIAYQPPSSIQLWLTKPTILTQALRRVCKVLTLKVLSQGFTHAPLDDKNKLSLDERLPFVRIVQLFGDEILLTEGRVTIAHQTYYRHSDLFRSLDTQPIGEKILYGNPDVRRSPFEYAFLEEKQCWGRRSVFFIREDPLLITEWMANTLPIYLPENL